MKRGPCGEDPKPCQQQARELGKDSAVANEGLQPPPTA